MDDNDNNTTNNDKNDTNEESPEQPTPEEIEQALSNSKLSIKNTTNDILTAYYLDSSGRAPLNLTLQIKCNDIKDTILLQNSGIFCLDKSKENINFMLECYHKNLKKHTNSTTNESNKSIMTGANVGTTSTESQDVSVEYISIKSSQAILDEQNQPDYFELNVEMMIQHILNEINIDTVNNDYVLTTNNDGISILNPIDDKNVTLCPSIVTNLEICGIMKRKVLLKQDRFYGGIMTSLEALELGGSIVSPSVPNIEQYGIRSTKTLSPIQVTIHLVNALSITVQEVGGARAASGATLVSLTIEHSNKHDVPVVVSNIALHPGHSRLFTSVNAGIDNVSRNNLMNTSSGGDSLNVGRSRNRSMQGGESAVIDMSHYCTWGYAQGTAPRLPLTLHPHEAISTVLQIDAWEEHYGCRTFLSPISVTSHCDTKQENEDKRQQHILSTYCKWTTARIAFSEQPVDAFRIDMSLLESKFFVGAPFVVYLQVLNLSQDDRDLMLLMAKDEEGKSNPTSYAVLASNNNANLNYAVPSSTVGTASTATSTIPTTADSEKDLNTTATTSNATMARRFSANAANNAPTLQQQQHHSVNTAVVSEVNGYTFGVWGLAGEDDGTIRHNRDHELLAVDAALLLGEVKGQHTIQAELRFVPLREGTLDVPNLKLYDKLGGRWYDCVHMLKIVASAN